MNDIEVPLTEMHDVDLIAVPRLQPTQAPARLHGRVSIGTPVVYQLTARAAAARNDEWRRFVESEASHSDYCLLSIPCTFRPPAGGDPLADAAIGIRLESPGEPPDRQPIAWSLAPTERACPVSRPAKITLTAKLAIIQSTVEYTSGQDGEDRYVVGLGVWDSDPEWRFRATSGRQLIGDEILTLVVKIPAGQPAHSQVTVAATIRHRHLGLVPYRALLPPEIHTIDLRGAPRS